MRALNLTRATLDACTKYPWGWPRRAPTASSAYDDDRPAFDWTRRARPPAGAVSRPR